MPADAADKLLVARIRRGDELAWRQCIDRFEGRLTAFAHSRLRNAATAEDVVQDTFVGFVTALPNFDDDTPIESFLFAICAHKLTDVLRREGRRPTIPLAVGDSGAADQEIAGRTRVASSLARSGERRTAEEQVIAACLRELIGGWLRAGDLERLRCIELLLVSGRPNKEVAEMLGLSEQQVANHKHFVVSKLKDAATQARVRDFNLTEFGLE